MSKGRVCLAYSGTESSMLCRALDVTNGSHQAASTRRPFSDGSLVRQMSLP